jgi:hypothetical protein
MGGLKLKMIIFCTFIEDNDLLATCYYPFWNLWCLDDFFIKSLVLVCQSQQDSMMDLFLFVVFIINGFVDVPNGFFVVPNIFIVVFNQY